MAGAAIPRQHLSSNESSEAAAHCTADRRGSCRINIVVSSGAGGTDHRHLTRVAAHPRRPSNASGTLIHHAAARAPRAHVVSVILAALHGAPMRAPRGTLLCSSRSDPTRGTAVALPAVVRPAEVEDFLAGATARLAEVVVHPVRPGRGAACSRRRPASRWAVSSAEVRRCRTERQGLLPLALTSPGRCRAVYCGAGRRATSRPRPTRRRRYRATAPRTATTSTRPSK